MVLKIIQKILREGYIYNMKSRFCLRLELESRDFWYAWGTTIIKSVEIKE